MKKQRTSHTSAGSPPVDVYTTSRVQTPTRNLALRKRKKIAHVSQLVNPTMDNIRPDSGRFPVHSTSASEVIRLLVPASSLLFWPNSNSLGCYFIHADMKATIEQYGGVLKSAHIRCKTIQRSRTSLLSEIMSSLHPYCYCAMRAGWCLVFRALLTFSGACA